MTTERRISEENEGEQKAPLVPAKEPAIPRSVTPPEAQELRARAAQVIQQLETATGSQEMRVVDSISSLGIQAQRQAGSELELLRVRVGEMVMKGGPSERISKDMVELRVTLNQIEPNKVAEEGLVRRVASLLPLGKDRILRVLERVAVRYEPVSKQVVLIETRLRDGRTMLMRDNIELRKLYEQVESQQIPIQKNAYLGELVMRQLEELIERTEDQQRRDRVQAALYDVSSRVQDLRTMEETHVQLFVSLEMTRQNNTRLGQAVDRTLTLATNVVMVGLAIQSALARQKRVLEATRRTREFLGNLLVANAATLKQHTTDIGDVYNSPVIALEKITKAHNDLIEAINIADRLKSEGIESAKGNIARLAELSAELEARAQSLRERRETQSLEA